MGFKYIFLFIYALILEVTNSNINCLHLIPAAHPCCSSESPLRDAGGAVSNGHSRHPLTVDTETDPLRSGQKIVSSMTPPPFAPDDDSSTGYQSRAHSCALIACPRDDASAVCACNLNTGHAVTFKNKCDVKKHNCTYDTAFKVILNEICPWEFERRGNMEYEVDYGNPKYYNK